MEINKFTIVLSFVAPSIHSSHLYVTTTLIKSLVIAFPHSSCSLIIANDNEILEQHVLHQQISEKKHHDYKKNLQLAIATLVGSEYASKIDISVITSDYIEDSLNRLMEFNPDCVIYWGGQLQAKNLRHLAFPYYPTLFSFFNIYNPVDKQVDLYLARQPNQILHGQHDIEKVVYQPMALELPAPPPHTYPPDYVKASLKEITLVTTLGGNRLADVLKKYSQVQFDLFFSILDKYPHARWIFVGVSDSEEIYSIEPRFSLYHKRGQFDIKLAEPNLRAFYAHCDIYVHLPGIAGGGGGVAMARAESVATLCYENSDACDPQWPQAVYSDNATFFSAIAYYIENSDARTELGRTVKNYMETNFTVDAVAKRLKENILLAIANYQKRLHSAIPSQYF